MARTYADIIAENQRRVAMQKNIIFSDDVKIGGLLPLAESTFLERISVKEPQAIKESPRVTTVGQEWRDEFMYLNIWRADVYDLIFVQDSKLEVALRETTPQIDFQFENYLEQLIKCNQFAPIGFEYDRPLLEADKFSLIDGEQVPYPQRYDFNFELLLRQGLVDVYLGRADVENTPLGLHASKRIREHFEYNVYGNIRRETSGRINTDLVGILNGDNTIIEGGAYGITVPKTAIGRAADFVRRLSGSYLPFSYLPNDINDPNELLAYTSRQQKRRLKELLERNQYRPSLDDPTSNLDVEGNVYWSTLLNSFQFGASESDLTFDEYNPIWRGKNANGLGLDKICIGIDDATSPYVVWERRSQGDTDRLLEGSILHNTQQLVNDRKAWIDQSTTSWTHEINSRRYRLSKGNSVQASRDFVAKDGTEIKRGEFFRAWTKNRPYNKLSRAIRSSGLFDGETRSVLQNNGTPKIAPYDSDFYGDYDSYRYTASQGKDIKKYMLSIENLAWTDFYGNLKPCEQGNGDLLSGHRGRIMWFAPYDLQYDESTSVNWQGHDFIGRGEKVYTYNNAERSMNLSFTMVVDHPNNMNVLRKQFLDSDEFALLWEQYNMGDEFIVKYVNDLRKENLEPEKQRLIEVLENKNTTLPQTIQTTTQKENYLSAVILGDEVTSTLNQELGEIEEVIEVTKTVFTSFNDSNHPSITTPILNSNPEDRFVIRINSEQTDYDRLCSDTMTYIVLCLTQVLVNQGQTVADANAQANTYRPRMSCEQSDIPNLNEINIYQINDVIETQVLNTVNQEQVVVDTITREELAELTYNECDMFSYLQTSQPLVFKTLNEKIDYFHPMFHSTTPQGLNSRMTFLLQCTRQGDSIGQSGVDHTRNLAFGRPPVVILSLSDTYKTKAIINTVNFNEMSGFDLNPDGIGVQPMIVKVSLSLTLIGGSSMLAPINRIQNALSFNFFKNTELYDNRADSVRVKSGDEDNFYVQNLDDNRYRQRKKQLENQYGENGRQAVEFNQSTEVADDENAFQENDLSADEFRNTV